MTERAFYKTFERSGGWCEPLKLSICAVAPESERRTPGGFVIKADVCNTGICVGQFLKITLMVSRTLPKMPRKGKGLERALSGIGNPMQFEWYRG